MESIARWAWVAAAAAASGACGGGSGASAPASNPFFAGTQTVDGFSLTCDAVADAACGDVGTTWPLLDGATISTDHETARRICTAMDASGGTPTIELQFFGNTRLASWNGTGWEFTPVSDPKVVKRLDCVF